MSDDLATLERDWDEAAKLDPFYNILTIQGITPERFWEMGEEEIEALLERIPEVNDRRYRALDFGCGIGRLTQALAKRFRRVDGVDISGEMIRLANEYNDRANCRFHHNTAGDLSLFKDNSFDLIYSMVVLQHMPPELAKGYVREFLRVSRGYVAFQIHQDLPPGGDRWLRMWGPPRGVLESWLTGATVINVEVDSTSRLFIVKP